MEKLDLEGMVSKRRNSPYRSGPSDAWVKTKCWDVGEFELMGVKTEPGEQATAFVARDGKYAGSATIALTKQMRDRLWQRVQKARADQPAGLPKAVAEPGVEWVKGINARVRYLRGEHKLRHATLQELVDD